MADSVDASLPSIHRPTTADDVADLVLRAVQESVPLTIVAGGHGPWSHAPNDGLRIELGGLADITVDGATVHVGGGAVWGDVAKALAAHDLALSSGDTATVGVGGLTLGGGVGWMVRAWGLAVDQLIGAQVVTAGGEIVETSAVEHPDLFWALRGGGGNFGVVTRFDFAAHPLPGIAFAESVIDGDAVSVLRAARDLLRDAPRELTATYMDVPAMDPSAPAGARLSAVWAAPDPERLGHVWEPITAIDGVRTEITTPAYRDILVEMPQPNESPDEPAAPPGFIGGNGLFAELGDDLIERLVAFRRTYPASVIFLRSLGGAFGDVPQEHTAFPARAATWFVMAGAFDIPGMVDDATRAQIIADWQAIEKGRLAEYGNFAATERADAVRGMFTEAGYERLRQVKAQWDPNNVFRRNHNVAL
ncbi:MULTISPECIES: FAD-binding oxidoreductase [unclassified Microbacterium]|uniref:FAD-binding oxidoreductase n=1 Tax=unclassified Microbacterium TaxID=2609290 RepID=UPI000EA8F6B1|nr:MULTISPECIES: FAD-binding oxidoreductase [unclassified Microbacterium]MBT2486811.1 FAD-binding oxidoreductase [Microbacterium sp. ISL-108]RKN64735.1 FAD-binding oxidoreductase [Microbacterium sp. CGR2]